ncbi:FbpB family small basic protein [Salipaludibacillus neizhouensis]|uniref:FbpB family small basic protein n=1 Tax=Salipaludibacillus neizhouensis TaxID=885475 RepID=A0A3A9K9I9_9BACI|nr:FbpB family small basic protein [Salipaludibacillus neizhouensis]RKL69167.1 FbpB family small basic protein [Salipaludibacillus neizhouensis]
MSRRKKLKFKDLFNENLDTLLRDKQEIEKIERRIEQRHIDKLGI